MPSRPQSDLKQHVLDVDEGGHVLVEDHGVLVLAPLVLPSCAPTVRRPANWVHHLELHTSHHTSPSPPTTPTYFKFLLSEFGVSISLSLVTSGGDGWTSQLWRQRDQWYQPPPSTIISWNTSDIRHITDLILVINIMLHYKPDFEPLLFICLYKHCYVLTK